MLSLLLFYYRVVIFRGGGGGGGGGGSEEEISTDDILSAMRIAMNALEKCVNPEEREGLEEEIASYEEALESLADDDHLFDDFEGSF